MFEQTDIDRVRELTDLVALIGEHVVLAAKGREHVGLCPFHDDKNPSFAVVTHKGNHFYKCHSCGASGDCFRFVGEFLQKNFTEAVEYLADRVGLQLTRNEADAAASRVTADRKSWLRKASAAGHDFFRDTLAGDQGQRARATIEHRNIPPAMVERFKLGAAPAGWDSLHKALVSPDLPERVLIAAGLLKKRSEGDGSYDAFRDRLIFPIHDDTGQPIAFGARSLDDDDQPKYLNSAEHDLFHKGRTLYGLHLARPAIVKTKQAIVTEGYTDVIACHGAGFENVIATLGTALTDEHVRRLARLCDRIVLVFDGDEAGRNAAERAVRIVFQHPVDVGICVLPNGQDPDDLLATSDGPASFQAAIDAAQDALDYLLERFRERLDAEDGLSARQRVLEQFIEMLRTLGLEEADGLRRSMLLSRIGDLMNVPVKQIDSLLRRRRNPVSTDVSEVQETATANRTGARHVAEQELLAVILYQTECFAETGSQPTDVLATDHFHDPINRTLAETLADLLQANPPTMQAVLGRLEGEAQREASSLYFIGQRLVKDAEEEDEGDHPLLRAIAALEDRIEEENRRQDVADWKTRGDTDDRTPADVIKEFQPSKRRPSAILRTSGTD